MAAESASFDQPAQPRVFSLGAWETNCYVVPTAEGRCVVFDPGFEPEEVLAFLNEADLVVERVLLTHAHLDHIAGLHAVRARFPEAPIAVHAAEAAFLTDPALNLSGYLPDPVVAPEPDVLLEENSVLNWGTDGKLGGAGEMGEAALRLRVLHTPGHSPGGATFVNEAAGWAIVGDTLFAGGVGRTDFPTSDPAALQRSIAERLYSLPDAMVVLPGHGPATTVGIEKKSNPYVRG